MAAFSEDNPTLLVVVIPALNEEATIGDVLQAVPRRIPDVDEVAVVVVDDGSTDETAAISRRQGAEVVQHPRNLGVGAAFASGIDRALAMNADIIVNIDADGQFQPADIPKLIRPILDEDYGFVTCTRFGDPTKIPDMPWIKLQGNRGMCWIINWITGTRFTDVSCGFRAYSRETALRLNLFGSFTYTQESFIDLSNKRVAMTEVPLVVRGERQFGKSRVASNLFRYGCQTLSIILRAFRDTNPLLLFGPVALACMFIGILCFGLVGGWWLATGHTSPWTSGLLVGVVFSVVGVLIGVLSLIADQIGRGRRIQEQLLYFERRRHYQRQDSDTVTETEAV